MNEAKTGPPRKTLADLEAERRQRPTAPPMLFWPDKSFPPPPSTPAELQEIDPTQASRGATKSAPL